MRWWENISKHAIFRPRCHSALIRCNAIHVNAHLYCNDFFFLYWFLHVFYCHALICLLLMCCCYLYIVAYAVAPCWSLIYCVVKSNILIRDPLEGLTFDIQQAFVKKGTGRLRARATVGRTVMVPLGLLNLLSTYRWKPNGTSLKHFNFERYTSGTCFIPSHLHTSAVLNSHAWLNLLMNDSTQV